MKTALRIIYVVLGIIVCIFTYVLAYDTNGYNYINQITIEAINNKDFASVAKIHGGCFDIRNLVTDDGSESYDLAIFRSTNLTQVSYKNEDNTVTDYKFEKNYYIYIANIKFDTSNYGDDNSSYNYAGIKFSNNDGGEYTYYFTVSNTINGSIYKETTTSVEDTQIHGSRSALDYYNFYGLINFNLTQSLVKAMSNIEGSTLNNDIDKITIIDSHNKDVGSYDISLDYEGQFYTDVTELISVYNNYITVTNSSTATDDEKKKASEEYNEFYSTFEPSFLANENYSFRYADSYLKPSSILWKSIGTTALVLVVAILLYILLFHFKFIKGIFTKNSQKYDRYQATGKAKNGTIITVKANTVKNDKKTDNKSKATAEAKVLDDISKEASNEEDNKN